MVIWEPAGGTELMVVPVKKSTHSFIPKYLQPNTMNFNQLQISKETVIPVDLIQPGEDSHSFS